MRKPIIVGNWKMNGSKDLVLDFANKVKPILCDVTIDCGIAAPFTLINSINDNFPKNFINSAQNMHFEESGAYTGELSANMLLESGANAVIIGHSERRKYFNETDELICKKIVKANEKSLLAIVCVGESLEERESGKHFDVVLSQVEKAYKGLAEDIVENTVIAYEPIWAIGTGKTATSSDAEQMCKKIRDKIKELYSENTSNNIRIQYGGSVKPSNVKEIMSMPNIDGALVGGASLKAEDFIDLITYNK